jgi:hypothetical protein
VVSRKSSILDIASRREKILPVQGDHSTMCKFASDGDDFRDVVDCMKELAAFALKKASHGGKFFQDTNVFAQTAESHSHALASSVLGNET